MKKKKSGLSRLLILFVTLTLLFGTLPTAFADEDVQGDENEAGISTYADASVTTPKKSAVSTGTVGEYLITLSTSGQSVPVQTSRDYIIVIDVSTSMQNDPIKEVKKVMRGQNGFLSKIFAKSGTTRVNIVTFGFTATSSGWLTSASAADTYVGNISVPYNNGTNYQAGLETATTAINSSTATEKYVLFLSDGEPTKSNSHGDGTECTKNVWADTVTAIDTFTANATAEKVTGIYPIAFNTNPSVSLSGQKNSSWTSGSHTVTFNRDGEGSYNFMNQLSPGNVKTATTANLDTIINQIVDQMNNMTQALIFDPINTTYFVSSNTDIYSSDNGFTVYKETSSGTKLDLVLDKDYTIDTSNRTVVSVKLVNELKGDETLYVQFKEKVSEAGYDKVFADNVGDASVMTNIEQSPDGAYTNGVISGNSTETYWYTSPKITIPTTSVTLNKTDSQSGSALSGAKFKLTRTDGSGASRTIEFGDDTSVAISSLPQGTYTLQETVAPDGHSLDNDVYQFTVTSDGTTCSVNAASVSPSNGNLSISSDGSAMNFKNAAHMGTLTVSKKVTGDNGSSTLDFEFKAVFTQNDAMITSGVYYYTDASGAKQLINLNPDGSFDYTLKDGQQVTFELPQGVSYKITETAVEGYTTKVNNNAGIEASGNITSVAATAAYVNNASSFVPSALTTNNLPFMLLIAGAGILGLALVIRKRTGKTKSGF